MSSKLLEQIITCILESKLGDIAGSVSEHHNEVNNTIKSHINFLVSQSIKKLSLYHTVAYQVCNSIVTKKKKKCADLNLQIFYC